MSLQPGFRVVSKWLKLLGSVVQIAFPVRFAPPVLHLRALLQSGALGTIYSLKTTNHGPLPGGWFVDRELAGGGAVIDHTVHVIDPPENGTCRQAICVLRWGW